MRYTLKIKSRRKYQHHVTKVLKQSQLKHRPNPKKKGNKVQKALEEEDNNFEVEYDNSIDEKILRLSRKFK